MIWLGDFTPECNAASRIDELIFGAEHLLSGSYVRTVDVVGVDMLYGDSSDGPSFQRMSECSSCSPGRCVPPDDAPHWCEISKQEPFGVMSTISCFLLTLMGMHVGHLFTQFSEYKVKCYVCHLVFCCCCVGFYIVFWVGV